MKLVESIRQRVADAVDDFFSGGKFENVFHDNRSVEKLETLSVIDAYRKRENFYCGQ
jgi:hypothetical protein